MTRIFSAVILMVLAAPALVTGAVMAPAVKLPSTTSPQYQMQFGPAIALPAAAPVITSVSPADCVTKGEVITIQGNNLLTPVGHSIAIDDANGTHIVLSTSSWSGSSITATVPNDPRVQENTGYWVGMETSPGQWVSNHDTSIWTCTTTASAQEPANNPPQVPSGGGTLLGGGMAPPPVAQTSQTTPIKEDVTVEPGEVMVVSADMNEAQQLQQTAQSMGLGIKRRTLLGNLGLVMSVLRVPKGTTVADALSQLRQSMPNTWMDANHRYQLQAGNEKLYASQAIAWNLHAGCAAGMNIGLIDTAIDETHPLFKGRTIVQRSFLASGIVAAPKDHGTATASILAAAAPTGLMPDVQLHVAAVFRSRNKEVDTTAEWIVSALDWLVGEKVEVINLSLGGSRNLLVEAAIQRVMQHGIVIVAAAGNGGADAEPVYPAAQPGVIAVTAVDANLKPYDRDNRGDYISYAAPGVDVWVAAPGGGGVYATGTSYAAPFVTAVIAEVKWSRPGIDRAALNLLLQSKARDLGAQGRDKVYGWGLIQMPVECARLAKVAQGKLKKDKQKK
jgi:minor extracellular protease Epr